MVRRHLLPHFDLEGCCTSPIRAGHLWPWSFPPPPYMYTELCDFEEREHTHFSIPQCLLFASGKECTLHKCLLNWWLDEQKSQKARCWKDVKQTFSWWAEHPPFIGLFYHQPDAASTSVTDGFQPDAVCALLGTVTLQGWQTTLWLG